MRKIGFFLILLVLFSCATNPHATAVKIYMTQQNFGKMLKEAKTWVEGEPNNPEAYLWLSRAYTLNKDYINAVNNLFIAIDKGLTKNLEDIDRTTLFNGGITAGQNKNFDLAIKCFQKLKELEHTNPRVYMNLAAFYQNKGEKDKAKAVLE